MQEAGFSGLVEYTPSSRMPGEPPRVGVVHCNSTEDLLLVVTAVDRVHGVTRAQTKQGGSAQAWVAMLQVALHGAKNQLGDAARRSLIWQVCLHSRRQTSSTMPNMPPLFSHTPPPPFSSQPPLPPLSSS